MRKRVIKTADEQDAYTRWRKYYAYLHRAGAVKRIKRSTHKRERREGQEDINEQLDDLDEDN